MSIQLETGLYVSHIRCADRMPFLPPNQQRQSTEGSNCNTTNYHIIYRIQFLALAETGFHLSALCTQTLGTLQHTRWTQMALNCYVMQHTKNFVVSPASTHNFTWMQKRTQHIKEQLTDTGAAGHGL